MMVNTTRNQCLNKLNIALNVLLQELTLEYDSDSLLLLYSCIFFISTFISTTGTFKYVFFYINRNRNSFKINFLNYIEEI